MFSLLWVPGPGGTMNIYTRNRNRFTNNDNIMETLNKYEWNGELKKKKYKSLKN